MAMEEVLDSVRRIVAQWTATSTPLISNVTPGDTILNVNNTKRFRQGDEITIYSTNKGAETYLVIDEILDTTHMQLTSAVTYAWTTLENALVAKTFYGNFIQGIYLGEPDPIPKFPAITIQATTRDSEWMTLDSTRETYKLELNVYVKAGVQEDAYRFLIRITDIIQKGLKQNIMPLVGPYETSALTSNAEAGDLFLKVADSSIFDPGNGGLGRAILEDLYKAEEFRIEEVVNSTTVKLITPVCFDYDVDDGTKLISIRRLVYNAWPDNIQYGTIFKGTLLKAAKISWFCFEEELQLDAPIDTSIT